MNKPTPVDYADDPSAAFVALPDAADNSRGGNDGVQRERPWWRLPLSAKRGQSAPARLLKRLTSAGNENERRLRLAQTIDDTTASTSAPPLRGGLRSSHVFLRALSSLAGVTRSPDIERFRCYICFDDVEVTEAVMLSSCGHRYCKSCLQSYLSSNITEGHVHPVCFRPIDAGNDPNPDEQVRTTPQITCGVAVADDQIQSIVHADVWTKFNKFRFNQKHQHARECPHCSFTQECAGPSNPSCVCSQCEKPFCFFHGNAHEYGTCSDYELKNAEAEALNRAMINKLAKPCPGCSRDIEKDGGCNHMTCVACQTSFCWLCGEAMESVAAHYDPAGEGACSGKQYEAVERVPENEEARHQPHDPNDFWRSEREFLELLISVIRFEEIEDLWGIGTFVGFAVAFILALLSTLIITPFVYCFTRKRWGFGRVYNKLYLWLENLCVRVFRLVDMVIFIAFTLVGIFIVFVIDVVAFLRKSRREQTAPPVQE